nr:siderophore-iron reductase FhuF [uncultured Halomonas sp.]
MLPTLTALFQGPLADFGGRLLLPHQVSATPIPARQLFAAEGLEAVLERQIATYVDPAAGARGCQPPDRRALMSQWSKYFLSQAIYVPVAANLLLDRQLPVALEELGVTLDAQGLVERLVVADEGRQVAGRDSESRLRPLMDGLLSPAIAAMAAHTGIAPRALWSNAGHYYAYLIDQLQGLPNPPAAVAEGARLMALGHFADGARNPLYRPIRHVIDGAGESRCVRRVCCVRYRLPELGYCGNCPLPAALALPAEEA